MAFPRPIKFTSSKQRFVSGIGDPWDPWDPVCSPGARYGTAQLQWENKKISDFFFKPPERQQQQFSLLVAKISLKMHNARKRFSWCLRSGEPVCAAQGLIGYADA